MHPTVSGMVNCVFCGHTYPAGTGLSKEQVLYSHIRDCPEHPLTIAISALQTIAGLCKPPPWQVAERALQEIEGRFGHAANT